MIDKLLGEAMKILAFKYNPKAFHFEIECVMPGHKVPQRYVFDKMNFPSHMPVKFLDEQVQIGDKVHVWLKEKEVLKSEGWKEIAKNTLESKDSPFKIGGKKSTYLGGAHQGTIHLDAKFQPFVMIKEYRFSPKEIKLLLKVDQLNVGKSAKMKSPEGQWAYSNTDCMLTMPDGYALKGPAINNLIHLLRRAKLV